MNLAPICLFTYNRLEETKKTIAALQKNNLASESELFVFSDGWNNETTKQKVLQVRTYLKLIKGFKKVTIYESKINKGLANSIINGVTKILIDFEKVIVLEDDLITTPNFLDYMNSALKTYKVRKDIISISGHSLKFNLPKGYESQVYLHGRAASWGWATWKDRWSLMDWEIKDWELFKKDNKAQKKFNANGSDMTSMLKGFFEGKNNSWAIRFCYNQFKLNMYTVFPITSKVDNIGFGENASNCKGYNRFNIKIDTTNRTSFIMQLDIKPNKNIINQIVSYHSIVTRLKSKLLTYYYNIIKK
ncbi:glycosyltransferase [uncultured Polaribacter sp.]|uniref:glycosyltransferase n=1 Tax=uncultured Polaribacter sp. TaxID=174711 RepID=UPI00261FDAC6|nr:glycosyltransferase [uncultured Polaribacter sp.]